MPYCVKKLANEKTKLLIRESSISFWLAIVSNLGTTKVNRNIVEANAETASMQGYTKDQPVQNNLYVNVIDDLQQIAENVGSKTYYHSFGKTIKPIKAAMPIAGAKVMTIGTPALLSIALV